MKKITLDFTGCKTKEDMHKILKESFAFPEYYGENLDALRDCLEDACTEPMHIYFRGMANGAEVCNEYCVKIRKVFEAVCKEMPNITFEGIA